MKSLIKIVIAVVLISLTAGNAECQIRVDLKKKLENKVNQRVNQRTDQAIDKGMDKVEGDIKGDAKKTDQANENQKAQDKYRPEQMMLDREISRQDRSKPSFRHIPNMTLSRAKK
jgi:hypothetical protein